MQGEYDGRAVPIGFIVDRRKEIIVTDQFVPNPTYKRFIVYEPHARVVRWLFLRFMECGGRVKRLYQELVTMPYVFPAFSPDVASHSKTLTPKTKEHYSLFLHVLLTRRFVSGLSLIC